MAVTEQVQSTLEAFGVDAWLIDEILRMLGNSEKDVLRGRVRTSAEGAFGSAPTAQVLSWDAATAHAKVAEAMDDLVAGLGGYADKIRDFRDDARRTDDDAAASLASLHTVTEQLAAPTIAAASENGDGVEGS
jgi:hypothetical protein